MKSQPNHLTSPAQAQFDDLVTWLRDHNGDVNHSSFVAACTQALGWACNAYSIRRPYGLVEGYPMLDMAASLLRTYIPSDVVYSSLPGYRAYRSTAFSDYE